MTKAKWEVMRKMWQMKAEKILLGKKIVKVSWLSDKDANKWLWHKRPCCFELDDGTKVIPMQDDEGNDGGALDCTDKGVLPVMGIGE